MFIKVFNISSISHKFNTNFDYYDNFYFYDSCLFLFVFIYIYNFSKAFKDEFLDLYITKIEDLKSELTTIDVKETKINIEDQLFFQVYFKELALAGILNQTKKFFPSFSDNPGSTSLYSRLNNIKKTNANFEIREDLAKIYVDRKEIRRYICRRSGSYPERSETLCRRVQKRK